MDKYDLLPRQLLHEGTCGPDNFFEPQIKPTHEKYIRMVHHNSYVDRLDDLDIQGHDARKIGFPLSEQLVERERKITHGTIKACEFALENGLAMNIAGGTHHAYSDHGEAFGEQGVWEHHIETHIPVLIEVPWLRVEEIKD